MDGVMGSGCAIGKRVWLRQEPKSRVEQENARLEITLPELQKAEERAREAVTAAETALSGLCDQRKSFLEELGLPDGYSCIADFGLLIKAALEAEQRGLSYHVGNVLTSDVFYAPEKAKKEGVGYEDVGVLAAEMETAALYANAALAGAQALSILTISASAAWRFSLPSF